MSCFFTDFKPKQEINICRPGEYSAILRNGGTDPPESGWIHLQRCGSSGETWG